MQELKSGRKEIKNFKKLNSINTSKVVFLSSFFETLNKKKILECSIKKFCNDVFET